MKRLIFISLFVFWSIIIAVLAAGIVVGNKDGVLTPASPTVPAGIILTVDEAAKHNSHTDCWLIISGKVYNVTSFLPSHPGGVSAIVPYCGKNATQAFNVSVPHSQNAHDMLASYYVGDLNQSVSSQAIQSSSNPVIVPSFGGDDD